MLNKPLGMCFIIADTAAQLHMGRGFFVLPLPFRGGILSGGDYVQGGIMSVSRCNQCDDDDDVAGLYCVSPV